MARQRDAKLVGTVGNIIFYNSMGEFYMRAKPVTVRRTQSSVNSGFNFGKASKISRQIRDFIDGINPSKSNKQAYRFNGAIHKFISWKEKKDAASIRMPDKLPFIYRFQFNDESDLSVITAIQPSVRTPVPGTTEIDLLPFFPSQNLHAPANTNSIILKMILMGVSLAKAETELIGSGEIAVPYSDELFKPPVISISNSPKTGDIVVMVMAIQYMVNKKGEIELLNDNKKMPCGICWAKYD